MRRSRGLLLLAAVTAALAAAPAWAAKPQAKTLHLGETFLGTGQTGSAPGRSTRAVGFVVVHGRWDGGPWRIVTRTRTDRHGRYRFAIRPHHRGLLTLRIVLPDRRPQGYLLRVV